MSGLVAATIIAGVLLIVVGVMRLGALIRMRGVPSLDSSAMHALEDLLDMCRERGVQLVISHPNDQPMRTMERAGFVDQVGRENFLPNIDAAIARAAVLVDEK